MRIGLKFSLGLVLLQICGLAQAAPSDDYRRGVTAFSSGNYNEALRFFLDARAGGMGTVTLRYNLGSTYFRLGNMDGALAQFDSIAEDAAWGPLAHYNMGLIEENRNRTSVALNHYRIAYERASTPKLKALAASRLDALSTTSAAPPRAGSWAGLLSLSGGYDDNVLLSDSQSTLAPSNQNDGFLDVRAFASRYLHGGFEDGWRLDLGGYYRAYLDLDDYSSGVANARILYSRLFTSWYVETGGKVEFQTSGGQHLATVGTYGLQALHAAGSLILRLRNDFSYYDAGPGYAFIQGWQNRTGFDVTHRTDTTRLRFGYELEMNHRKDNAFGNEFTSYSPVRHRVFADIQQWITPRFRLDAGLEYRASKYRDANAELDTNSVLVSAKRDDDRLTGSLRLAYQARPHLAWVADYQHAKNDSNFDQYGYRNNQASIGFERTY
jgi:tetratricopeptide (TPR) repeat protein